MNEEIDESEFYHEDFTTASEWEILVAHMEEIVNQWKTDDLKNSEILPNSNGWHIRTEKLVYIDSNFDFTWYKKIKEVCDNSDVSADKLKHPLDKWYDFSLENYANQHKDIGLTEWYGLDEYLVLSSAGNVGVTNNESRAKILLSSGAVLINNLTLEIPIFIQIRDKWQKVYCGIYESNGIRTNFDIVHLKRGLYYCKYLTGLLDMFKTKIMSPCTIDNIFISYQGTYSLQDFGNFIWKQDFQESMDIENLFILPFGVSVEPVNTIYLKAIWSQLSEHSVIDTESYSDFDPLKAQKWHCSVTFTQDPVCLLGECLAEFLEVLNNNYSVYDILGDFAVSHTQPDSNPLDLLTESSVPSISSLLNRATRSSLTKNKRGNPPLQENVLVPLLYFLFPDADENMSYPYNAKYDKEPTPRKFKLFTNQDDEFKGFKTCTEDSLIWRLAIVLSHTLQSLGGLKAFCHIWYEFVQEMRYRWEKSMSIPGLSPGMPNLRSCLLNQKLQMLNCCLERKISREAKFASAENSEESDDEFFDANDDIDEKRREKTSTDKPAGRLSKFGGMKLLKTGEPLYIPFTQDPVLKTEDQLEEDTDILLKLGSDQEASELRARIMSASLLSDMESFKAANPGCIVEDFIRWYSPRDWIESDELDAYGQKKGNLSPRMQLEDNIWVEMWETARPVPANRQKRLFDDTREAEKVLQFLDFRSAGQIAELVIPILTQAAICRLIDEIENLTSDIPEVGSRVTSLLKHGERISRDIKLQPKRFEVFIQEVTGLELQISQINSLAYKLNPQGVDEEEVCRCVGYLASGESINIDNKESSLIGSRIVSMLTESHRFNNIQSNEHEDSTTKTLEIIFPAPAQKEFVLRANCVRPSLYSAKSPQFLRAILGKDEFRLVGAFSEDSAFF